MTCTWFENYSVRLLPIIQTVILIILLLIILIIYYYILYNDVYNYIYIYAYGLGYSVMTECLPDTQDNTHIYTQSNSSFPYI